VALQIDTDRSEPVATPEGKIVKAQIHH
jgi:hypothetical protein